MQTVLLLMSLMLIPTSVTVAEDIKTADVLGTNTEAVLSELDIQEEEREEDFFNQLLLRIPTQTDNPSHIITFIDPSEQKSGVQLEIDSKSFQDIKSPYSLPSLNIGKHSLRFKFVDKYGATQILEKEIIVLPRPPIINSPTLQENILTVSGTGLGDSEIMLILSSSNQILTETTTINTDGTWEIKIDDELVEGVYTFTGYTRKYGYAGNLAEPVTFQVGNSSSSTNSDETKQIHFAFSDINMSNIREITTNNKDLLILIAAIFTLGFVLAYVLFKIIQGKEDEHVIKGFEEKIESNKEKDGRTLIERLKGETPKEELKEDLEVPKVEKKTEKIVTKIDFLKNYKSHDPDNEKGNEKTKEEEAKNITISLTSKN